MPEIEEREAAIFNGYSWKEWSSLDILDPYQRYERVSGIAHYRLHSLIENHTQDAISMEIDRQSKVKAK